MVLMIESHAHTGRKYFDDKYKKQFDAVFDAIGDWSELILAGFFLALSHRAAGSLISHMTRSMSALAVTGHD